VSASDARPALARSLWWAQSSSTLPKSRGLLDERLLDPRRRRSGTRAALKANE
jgi:hypothetical protein